MTEAILVATGDLHINSTVALCYPAVTLDDGGTYRASAPQRWIWRKWIEYWQEIKRVKTETGRRRMTWLTITSSRGVRRRTRGRAHHLTR